MAVDALIVGTGSSAVDLVAEGLVDPEAVTYSSSARGFESCDFPVAGRPHVRAHHALVPGASVRVLAGGPAWEGTVLSVNDAGSPHVVECGGRYETLKHRQDYTRVWTETDCALFVDATESYLTPAMRLVDAQVSTEEGLLIVCPTGAVFGANQQRIAVLRIGDGRHCCRPATSGQIAYDATMKGPSGWVAYIALLPDMYEDNGIAWDLTTLGDAIGVGTKGAGYSGAWSSGLYLGDMMVLVRLVAPGTGGTLTQDAYVHLRGLRSPPAPKRVDELLSDISYGVHSATSLTAIGSTKAGRVAFDGPGTRAEAFEWALSLHSAPVLAGYWDGATLHAKPRPTTPDDRRRWYVLNDDDLDSPGDWFVVRDTEAQLDAVCAEYGLTVPNLVTVPTPPDAAWPSQWDRSSVTNCAVISSSGFRFQARSNATVRTPSMWCDSTYTNIQVVAHRRYLARCRALVSAYPGSGDAAVWVTFYTSAGGYISTLDIKSWTAAAATEEWYELVFNTPSNAAYCRVFSGWRSVTGGTSDCDLWTRDFELRPVTPAGTLLRAYHPAEPNTGDPNVRVGLLPLDQATTGEAAEAAAQCFLWYADMRHGGARPRSLRTVDGSPVDLRQVRAWDWISKKDDPDGQPLFISRAQYGDGQLSLDIGSDDAYAPPGYRHIKPVGRYVAGFRHRDREKWTTWWSREVWRKAYRAGKKVPQMPRRHPKWHYGDEHEHEGYYS